MSYLTYSEYTGFGFSEIDEVAFDNLVKKAGDVIDSVTRHFYKFNDIDKDVPFRREQFKKAVGAQIEYFHQLGATTYESINATPQTFSAGRTSVSNASRFNPGGKNESKSLAAEDALMYLSETGLLYRGISVW